jgi:serine/threonine-protein kinase
VQIYSAGWDEDEVYFAMRYIRGRNLLEIINQEGPLTPRKAVNYLLPISDALKYAHRKGLIHRDIKPANIIIDEQGTPMLADFGLAMNANTKLETTGIVYGTMQYMSPEQFKNERLDYRTDVYSFGISFYEIVIGKPPFHRLSKMELANAVVNKIPAPPSQIAPDLPEELSRLIARLIEKDPNKRVNNYEEMNQLLYRLSRNPQLDLLSKAAPHTINKLHTYSNIKSEESIVDSGISIWYILLEHLMEHPILYITFIVLAILVIIML